MSSRPVRAGLGQPGSGAVAENQQTDGCPNPDPVMLPGSTSLNCVIENPISTEVRLLDHTGSPSQDYKATESSLKVTMMSSKPGEGTRPLSHQAWLLASSHPPNPHSPQASRSAAGDERGPQHHCVQRGLYGGTQGGAEGSGPPASLAPPLPLCLLPDSSLPPTLLQVLPRPPKTVGPEQCLAGVSGWYPRG